MLGIESLDLRTGRLVIGQGKKAQLSARPHWPDNHRRLRSVRSQLLGEMRWYFLSAVREQKPISIKTTWLGMETSAVLAVYIYWTNWLMRCYLYAHTYSSLLYQYFSNGFERRDKWNVKTDFLRCCRTRSILENLESLITCLFSNIAIALSGNLLISDPEL